MHLSRKDYNKLLHIIDVLHGSLSSEKIREKVGYLLLDLLQADYFASFVFNEASKQFDRGVTLNMDGDNLANYNRHFYCIDPITSQLQEQDNETSISQVIPQSELIKTEFFQDFLNVDDLYYGLNLHVKHQHKYIGDLRIWRAKNREDFGLKEQYLLDKIKPHFYNAMRNIYDYECKMIQSDNNPATLDLNYLITIYALTPREAQVTLEILKGQQDDLIAKKLHIAFSTLRTHLKNIFSKLNVNSRALLLKRIYLDILP